MENISTPDTRPPQVVSLTRDLAAGDEDAFREFHALYFDRLYRFLLVVTRGNEHDAQEALQETLLRVLRHARAFESEEAFWDWLKVVARNVARDVGRKQRRYLGLLQKFASGWHAPDSGPVQHDDGRLRTALEESLLVLEPEDRQIVEGKYLDGATVKELSERTGFTEKAVESRLLRSRWRIREFILKKLQTP